VARQQLALLCRDQGRDADAEELWRRSVAEQPTYLPAWLGLGELYLAQKRWDVLEELAGQLAALPDAAGEALVLRGRAALACRDFATARTLLEQAIASAPHAVLPRLYLTHVLLQEHRDLIAAEQALRG
jgi:tetratricopeptide (TPR) repeat protein